MQISLKTHHKKVWTLTPSLLIKNILKSKLLIESNWENSDVRLGITVPILHPIIIYSACISASFAFRSLLFKTN
jgi:hypothetical protein